MQLHPWCAGSQLHLRSFMKFQPNCGGTDQSHVYCPNIGKFLGPCCCRHFYLVSCHPSRALPDADGPHSSAQQQSLLKEACLCKPLVLSLSERQWLPGDHVCKFSLYLSLSLLFSLSGKLFQATLGAICYKYSSVLPASSHIMALLINYEILADSLGVFILISSYNLN